MFPILFLLMSGWLFYRLAWKYDKSPWKFAFIGIAVYLLLFSLVCCVLSALFAIDTGESASLYLAIHLQILFGLRFDFLLIAVTFIPIAVLFFVIYKVIEYRWKRQEGGDPKNNQELLDN